MNRGIPIIAEWLLERFGVPQRNDSLVGDLLEERRAGRSALWLWRQVANAIAITVTRDITHHWLLTARAIALGWALWVLWTRIWNPVIVRPWPLLPLQIMLALTFILWPAFIGWAIARAHRAYGAAMVLAYAASQAIYAGCYIVAYIAIHHPGSFPVGSPTESSPWLVENSNRPLLRCPVLHVARRLSPEACDSCPRLAAQRAVKDG